MDGPRPPRPVVQSRADLGRRRACGARRAAADPRHGRDVAGQPAPDDLRATAAGVDFLAQPFVPLYRTDDEFAAELSNRNIHAVMHLAWAEQASGDYQGRMAVYVKPRGWLGSAQMAFIKPFRYLVVYPALTRHIERAWNRRVPRPSAQPPDHPRHTEGIIPMSDAVAAATQLHPHRQETAQIGSSRPSQTECWRSGTTSAAASRLRSPT